MFLLIYQMAAMSVVQEVAGLRA